MDILLRGFPRGPEAQKMGSQRDQLPVIKAHVLVAIPIADHPVQPFEKVTHLDQGLTISSIGDSGIAAEGGADGLGKHAEHLFAFVDQSRQGRVDGHPSGCRRAGVGARSATG
jgi:hypothetical protein